MTSPAYPIHVRLATRVPEWEDDISFTLRVAEHDPIHGQQALRECLLSLQRELQQFMLALDADERCDRCGALPDQQIADWVPRSNTQWLAEGQCNGCGSRPVLQPIAVRPITREEADIDY